MSWCFQNSTAVCRFSNTCACGRTATLDGDSKLRPSLFPQRSSISHFYTGHCTHSKRESLLHMYWKEIKCTYMQKHKLTGVAPKPVEYKMCKALGNLALSVCSLLFPFYFTPATTGSFPSPGTGICCSHCLGCSFHRPPSFFQISENFPGLQSAAGRSDHDHPCSLIFFIVLSNKLTFFTPLSISSPSRM